MTASKKASSPEPPGSSPVTNGSPSPQEETTTVQYPSPEKNADGDPVKGEWDMFLDLKATDYHIIRKCSKCKHVTAHAEAEITSFAIGTEPPAGNRYRNLNILLCTNCGNFKTQTLPEQNTNN